MSLRVSLTVACGLAASNLMAGAAQTAGSQPEGDPIFRCVVDYLRVDGLPLVQHSWCTRKYPGGPAIPLLSLEGEGHVFGIKPWTAPPAPPIPKKQRPLE